MRVGSIECPITGTYAHAAPRQDDDPEGVDRLDWTPPR
jgi:hypothetical protein